MSRTRLTRALLLSSVSALALPLATSIAPAHAGGLPPGMTFTIEGGAACTTGNTGKFTNTYNYLFFYDYSITSAAGQAAFGKNGCGWTGRIGLFQDKPDIVPGWVDFWGIFVRRQEFGKDSFRTSGTNNVKYDLVTFVNSKGAFDEDRTVVDFEVGKNLGIGSGGSKLRLFGGIRYANYSNSLHASGTAGSYCAYSACKYIGNPFSARSKSNFDGVGPRLGLTGDVPLFGPFFLTGSVSGSLLWGDHQVGLRSSGFYPGGRFKFSDSGMVTNAEGEVGVGLPFFATGGTLVFGARWEGWFDQTKFKNYKVDLAFDCGCLGGLVGSFDGKGTLDRNNWGPFVRLNIPLGGAPPPP